MLFHWMYITHLISPFICYWAFGLFLPLAIVNNAAWNIGLWLSGWVSVFSFFECIQKSVTHGSCDNSVLNILRNYQTVCIAAAPFYIPTSNVSGFHFSHILPSTRVIFWFLILAVLIGGKWYLVVLIFISLMTSNVEHLVMCLLAICVSSLEICPLFVVTHFSGGLIFVVVVGVFFFLRIFYFMHSTDRDHK